MRIEAAQFPGPGVVHRRAVRGVLGLLLLAATACTPADRQGCPSDVRDFGSAEAAAGKPPSLPAPQCRLSEAEAALYAEGRAAGQAQYCSGRRGFQLGLDGREASLDCGSDPAAAFSRGLEVGTQLRTQLAAREALIREATQAEARASNSGLSEAEREAARDAANRLRLDARSHENEIEALRGIAAVEKWR